MKKENRKNKYDVDFMYNWKVFCSFLKNYKGLIVFLIIISFIQELVNFAPNLLYKIIIDNATEYGAKSLTLEIFTAILINVGIVFVSIRVVSFFIRLVNLDFVHKLESNLISDLKRRFFNHIVNLSHGFHTSHKTGSLISRIQRGASSMERMADFFVYNVIPVIFNSIVLGFTVIYFNLINGIIIFSTITVFVIFSLYMQHIQRRENQKLNMAEDVEKANLADIMTNIDSIKYYGKEDLIKKKYYNLTENTRKNLVVFWSYHKWNSAVQSLISGIGTFFLLFFSLRSYMAGDITLGTLVFSYSTYGSLFYGYIIPLMNGLRGYYRSMVDFHDLFQYGEIEQEVKDSPGAKSINIKKGEIEFDNVSFKYHERTIINNFNLKIKPGEKIALVGHSGSGKSTLVKLLYRLYDVDKGSIKIDGTNIKEVRQESLRSELSVVPQECVLFDDTVFNNIAFSDSSKSKAEVVNAMKLAQLYKTVKNFPHKENTIVGERGIKLSGGEKQRVSIARALLADKRIIVLDEATSSLDSKTEHEIQDDLKTLLEGRTAIIIAHRLSTIMSADKIIVLDKGRIAQIGKHEELISKKGIYKELWGLQKGGYLQE